MDRNTRDSYIAAFALLGLSSQQYEASQPGDVHARINRLCGENVQVELCITEKKDQLKQVRGQIKEAKRIGRILMMAPEMVCKDPIFLQEQIIISEIVALENTLTEIKRSIQTLHNTMTIRTVVVDSSLFG
jgi:hypothetical protein